MPQHTAMEFSGFGNTQGTARSSGMRGSLGNRISRLFSRRSESSLPINESHRTSAACEVPIFMSPSTDQLNVQHVRPRSPGSPRSLSSTRSMIDAGGPTHRIRPLTLPASSGYSESPGQQHAERFEEEVEGHTAVPPPHDLEEGRSTVSYTTSVTQDLTQHNRKRRTRVHESTRRRIEAKKRLILAFGITLLAATITYLTLAVTGTARGLMFHVLSVLFVLALAGVFLHSTIRLIMLQKRRRARQARHRDWHGSAQGLVSSASASRRVPGSVSNPFDDPVSEKPIEIVMGGDEVVTTTPRGKNKKVVRPPPPVYGSIRESKRMNPGMVFWSKQNPSPTTPTYEEAMKDVQTAVGFQPPQYVSPKRERQTREVYGQRASNIHPLERERLVGLMGNTMSSQNQL